MQKVVCFLVLALAQTSSLFAAAASTLEQLRAIRTKKQEVILTIEKDKLYWNVDEPGTRQSFAATAFGTHGDTAVSIIAYNPILFEASLKAEDLDDSSAAAVDTLGGALGKFVKVEAGEKLGVALGTAKDAGEDCEAYKTLHASLILIRNALIKAPTASVDSDEYSVDADTIKRIANAATGKDAVHKAAKIFDEMAKRLDEVVKGIRTNLATIQTLIPTATVCPKMTPGTLALITSVTFDGNAALSRMEQSSASLKKVAKFLNDTQWKGTDRYVVDHVPKWKTVTVTVTPHKLEVRPDGMVTRTPDTDKKALTATFKLVGYRRVVAEVGGGAIWVDDTVPVYGTTQKDGKTVVSVKQEKLDLKAAVVTNFVLRVTPFDDVFPLVQIGVSSHENFPAVLLGGGVKVAGSASKHFSITAGTVYFRPKELKGLNEGDPVGGTGDIQEKLSRVGRWAKYYVGLQVVF